AILPVLENRLIAAEAARAGYELMAAFGELGPDRRRDPGFHLHQANSARRLPCYLGPPDVAETHEIAGLLHIHSEIDHVDQDLDMALRLHVAAHQPEREI